MAPLPNRDAFGWSQEHFIGILNIECVDRHHRLGSEQLAMMTMLRTLSRRFFIATLFQV